MRSLSLLHRLMGHRSLLRVPPARSMPLRDKRPVPELTYDFDEVLRLQQIVERNERRARWAEEAKAEAEALRMRADFGGSR